MEDKGQQKIVRRDAVAVPPDLAAELPPLLARVYAARRVQGSRELDYSLARLHAYGQLGGMDQAVGLLQRALDEGQRILVVGDFDADGATSSALVVRALRAMGAADVGYLVPNRFEYGYGLTPEIVRVAARGSPDLIITVDNGIASVDGVAVAASLGIRVLVTDHHLPGEHLPVAAAIVNPNLPGDGFPSKHLAGVGVAFYLMAALRAGLREAGWFPARGLTEPNLAELLDLVALGTVADVVPLDRNNRILVSQGMARIRGGRCNAGIKALLEVSGRDYRDLVASDLGFAVGPRLNAAGRIADMALGVACLLSDDQDEARELAGEMDRMNRERRQVEGEMQAQALSILEAMELGTGVELPYGLCLFDGSWHEGVIGILASRIKERLHRPVIAFAPASADTGQLKGSARSIKGLHIRDALDAVATRHPGLITRFGGHAMAAGLALPEAHMEPFREAFDQEVRRHLEAADLHGALLSDGPLEPAELDLALAESLRRAGPWGQGFPEPLFDGEFELVQRRIVGRQHLKMLLRLPETGKTVDAIAFNTVDEDWPPDVRRVLLAYRLDVNAYQGRRSLQLIVEHVEPR